MARDSLPTRQPSASGNRMVRVSKVTAPQSSSSTGGRPSASTKRGTMSASGIEVLADPYEVDSTAGPSSECLECPAYLSLAHSSASVSPCPLQGFQQARQKPHSMIARDR